MQGILGLVVRSGCEEARGESNWVRNGLTERGPQNLTQSQNRSRNGSLTGRNSGSKSLAGSVGGPVSGSKSHAHKKTGAKGRLNLSFQDSRAGVPKRVQKRVGSPFLADGHGRASTK